MGFFFLIILVQNFVHWRLKLLNFLMDSVLIPVFTLEQFQTVSVLTSPQSYLFTSATVRILFTLHQSLAQNLSDMWRSTLYIGAAQLLSVTEIIAPKSPFLCENRSFIQYGFAPAQELSGIECFHKTSRRPYWCSKTMKRRPCWCPKPILWELNSFLMQTLSFVPINLHRCWPREWKHSIVWTLPQSACFFYC